MHADPIIRARMACAVVSGAIVALVKTIVEHAAKAIAVHNLLLHRRVQAHPIQTLLQTLLRHLLDSTTMLITEKIVVSSHTSEIGKLVPPISKSMHTRTL